MKAISIIVPVYQVEKYIIKCLNSICNQTFRDFELIIIDDCGSDPSIKLAANFLIGKEIDFTIIHHKENMGLSASRNTGIEASKANYIIFIDSDDWIEETMLEKLYQAAIKSNADIVSCNGKEYLERENVYRQLPSIAGGRYAPGDYLIHLFNKEMTAHIWLRMFKRTLFAYIRFPEQVIFEDFLTLPFLVEKANHLVHTDEAYYNYVQRNFKTNITASRPTNVPGFMRQLKNMELHFIKSMTDKNIKYLLRYEFLLLAFILSNLFKSSLQFKDIKDEVNSITAHLSFNKLFKVRKVIAEKIWFFLLMVKINGKAFYFIYKHLR